MCQIPRGKKECNMLEKLKEDHMLVYLSSRAKLSQNKGYNQTGLTKTYNKPEKGQTGPQVTYLPNRKKQS